MNDSRSATNGWWAWCGRLVNGGGGCDNRYYVRWKSHAPVLAKTVSDTDNAPHVCRDGIAHASQPGRHQLQEESE